MTEFCSQTSTALEMELTVVAARKETFVFGGLKWRGSKVLFKSTLFACLFALGVEIYESRMTRFHSDFWKRTVQSENEA